MRRVRSLLFSIAFTVLALEFGFFVAYLVRGPADSSVASVAPTTAPAQIMADAPEAAVTTPPATIAPATIAPATIAPATIAPATATPSAPTAEPPTASPSAAPTTASRATKTVSKQMLAFGLPTKRSPVLHVVTAGTALFAYEGRWDYVSGKRDGRLFGRSSRSFVRGSRATLAFEGRFVRLYGVVGPGGGFGAVDIDGSEHGRRIVNFYAPQKAAHRLLYESSELRPGPHRLTIAVVPIPQAPAARTRYVNIEGAEFGQ